MVKTGENGLLTNTQTKTKQTLVTATVGTVSSGSSTFEKKHQMVIKHCTDLTQNIPNPTHLFVVQVGTKCLCPFVWRVDLCNGHTSYCTCKKHSSTLLL